MFIGKKIKISTEDGEYIIFKLCNNQTKPNYWYLDIIKYKKTNSKLDFLMINKFIGFNSLIGDYIKECIYNKRKIKRKLYTGHFLHFEDISLKDKIDKLLNI